MRRVRPASRGALLALVASACAALVALASLGPGAPRAAADASPALILWHAYGEHEASGLRDAVDAWEAAHPGARVDVVPVPFGAYASKLESAIPTGNGPDLFIDAHDRLPSYLEASLVSPIGALDAALVDDLEPDALAALTLDGARYGLPLQRKSAALYVNDALADGRSLDTLEALEALVGTLPPGVTPFAWEPSSAYAAAALMHAYGASYLDTSGRWSFEGDGAARALARLASLVAHGVVPEESSGDLVQGLFRSGRAVTAVSGPWLAPSLPSTLRWSVRALPAVRDAGGRRMEPFSTIEAAMISARARDVARATSLAAFLAGREGSVRRARAGGHVVTSRSAWDDPALAGDARLVAFREAARAARPMPTSRLMRAVFGPAERAIRRVLRGDAEPRVALAEASRRFDDETRPPPEARDPSAALALLSLALVALLALVGRQVSNADVRVALARSMPAYAWLAHAVAVVGLLVVLPLTVGALTSFFAGRGADLHYVGVANYVDILTARGGALLGHGSFWLVLLVTVLWTVVNVAFHVAFGVALALVLSRPAMRLKGLYRVLLVLPWAVPSYVTALAWRGMFHRQLGAVNALLAVFGVEPVSWFASFGTAFAANVATNVWLGFPFMMVVTLGALTSISRDLYEAAAVDGASAREQFLRITLPLLRPSLLPAVAMGAVWTFNMFNVVFLVSAGEPDGATEILVSEAYRWAFTRGHQVGYAAAYAVLIFGILLLVSRAKGRIEEAAAR